MPFGEPLSNPVPRYSREVKAPRTLVLLPKAHDPNSKGVNSHTVALAGTTISPASRLWSIDGISDIKNDSLCGDNDRHGERGVSKSRDNAGKVGEGQVRTVVEMILAR